MDVLELGLKVACIGAVVPPLSAAIALMLREARRARISAVPAADDGRCVACGEAVQPGEDAVYVCGACGQSGGSGLAERERRQRRQRLGALPQAERDRLAREAVAEARLRLDLAEPALVAFRPQVVRPAAYATARPELLEGSGLQEALSQVGEAYAWLERAAEAQGRALGAVPPEPEPAMWFDQLGQLDTACVLDDVDGALAAIGRAREAAGRLVEV